MLIFQGARGTPGKTGSPGLPGIPVRKATSPTMNNSSRFNKGNQNRDGGLDM